MQQTNHHKFPYRWTLKDAKFTKDKGKVFSCFACGGGSTMGYKLAGFDVIGCNEIDPRMNKVYVANHHPRLNYLCDIREMVTKELPDELYHLDVLDGSPPCSSFSVLGNRDEDWGKEKKFREGQAMQVLDTLFFDFIDLAKELQPKIVIAENVKGLLLGEAFNYVRRIYEEFDKAGYVVCHTLCDATYMGVPQMRKRVFFTAIRKDLFQYTHNGQTYSIVIPSSTSTSTKNRYYGARCTNHAICNTHCRTPNVACGNFVRMVTSTYQCVVVVPVAIRIATSKTSSSTSTKCQTRFRLVTLASHTMNHVVGQTRK